MKVKISPKKLSGTLQIMPSKSHAHRIMIGQKLAGVSITIPSFSEDIVATKMALEGLKNGMLLCKESGSTLRFLLPIAGVLRDESIFTMEGRLCDRPLSPLKEEMESHGTSFAKDGSTLKISGKMSGGIFNLAGNVSSQFITGLLFALPLTSMGGEIRLTSPLESRGYVDLTIEVLRSFNINIEETSQGYKVLGNQKYTPSPNLNIEADWSNAAFFIVANTLGSKINCLGLNHSSKQPDTAILDLINEPVIDASKAPDLVPILAIKAALTKGITKIINAKRLRLKESDRLSAISTNLRILGIDVVENQDNLIIHGGTLNGGNVSSFNDHRIAMAMAIGGTCSQNPIIIEDAQAINKSYPDFFKDFSKLGGDIVEI